MKFPLSTLSIALIVLACFIIDMTLKNWKKQERVIEHDVHQYYAYLPAQFIFHDIKLTKSDYRYGDDLYWFWPTITPGGKKVIKMTMGLSLMYAPFFFVAHGYALISDYPVNGFSEPYKVFLLLSAIFYLFVGLDFLKKILQHYGFSDTITAITLLLVGLGTNLLCYSSQSAPMSHVYSFCLFSVFIYYTIRWYELQTIKNTLVIGLLAGLISLIRPSDAVLLIFFVLFDIGNFSDFRQRLLLYKRNFFLLLLMGLLSFLVWAPQFAYWKTVTGKLLFYSYTDEGFFWSHPKIIDGLFSFRKGWLVYTPIMSFALIGIFLMRDAFKKLRLPIILFFLVNIYVIFSWWCWWYGGTYGQRSLVESYAILAIPMASFIKFLSEKKWIFNILFYCVAAFFIWLNIFQTYQYEYHSLHWDGMSKKLYFKQFGRINKIADYDSFVDWPNYEKAKFGDKYVKPAETKNEQKITPDENRTIQDNPIKTNGKLIYLKASNNKFVCADAGRGKIVVADKEKASLWETFSLQMMENNKCIIRSFENKFLSADIGSKCDVTAFRDKAQAWEIFTIEKPDSDYIALKAANGKYLTVDEKTLQLFARNNTIGRQEKFKMIIK
ncbi:MAG: hypothetical protein HY958_05890 [Bacteroidia bacterium]|nr:hypothetical protein [Bacteroidia bacterium]